MSVCDRYSSSIQKIDLDECIGLSLASINSNFQLLQEQNCLDDNELKVLQTDLSALNTKYATLTALRSRIARANISFKGTGSAPLSVYTSFNMSALRVSTGVYTLSFAPPLPNTNYALVGTSASTLVSNNYTWLQPLSTFTTTSATINIRNRTGTLVNPEYISIAVYSL
jgi:hypothetical protein